MRRPVFAAFFCALMIFSGSSSRACTSFCFDTPKGPVYGTNLDLTTGDGHLFVNRRGLAKEGYGESTAGEPATWIARFGSVTFNLVGRELPFAGMNEAGLVMSTMQLNASRCPEPDERPPVSEAYLVQYVLDTCRNIPEAIEAVSRVRPTQHECASHYMIADETGECATIEFLDGRFVYYAGESLPVKALANAPYAAGIAYIERGVVPADNPGESVERVAAAAYRMASFDPKGRIPPVDYALDILTETVVSPKKWWKDWFDEPYTRWNIVFDIARREAHFRTAEDATMRSLSLHNFDFSCEAPLLMLDVNTKLSGNIDQAFGPYDHDVNLKTLRTFCDKWGIPGLEGGLRLVGGALREF